MATSDSYNFSMNRDEIITAALRVLGYFKAGVSPTTDMKDVTAQALNLLLKTWNAQGMGLWLWKQVTVFPQYDTASTSIGPTGGHATESYTRTTLATAAEEDDLTIAVSSATGVTSTYNIGIELDDKTMQWTTVNGAPAGTTVTITAALTDDAAAGNTVFVYQTKTQRPLDIYNVRLKDTSTDDDLPLTIVAQDDYINLSNKSDRGQPNQVYYDPQLTNGVLYTWPAQDDVDNVIVLTINKPIQDFDAATDDADFPVEWIEPVKYNLALRMAPELFDDIAEDRMKYIREMAKSSLEIARNFDSEHNASITMVPDRRNYEAGRYNKNGRGY